MAENFKIKIVGGEARIYQEPLWGESICGVPPVHHSDLAPHAAEISEVVLDYLRRRDMYLPACTRVMAYEWAEKERENVFERHYKNFTPLRLPLLTDEDGPKGWDMVV